MAPFSLFVALAASAQLAHGHYTFVRIKTDGEWNAPLRYIRNKTDPFDERIPAGGANFLYRGWNWPTYNVDFPNSIRCGRGNMDHANETEVLTVKAGDTIEIAHQRYEPAEWFDGMFDNCPDGYGTCNPKYPDAMDFNHPGPLVVHLSKTPDGQDVTEYDGSGEWTKIHSVGLTSTKESPVNWLLYRAHPPRMPLVIPAQTPPGQYLMRMDVIWSTARAVGQTQFYPSCAQLNIVSDSKTALPEGVKIPEILADDQPGILTSRAMLNMASVDANFTYPGGPLWDGQTLVADKPDLTNGVVTP